MKHHHAGLTIETSASFELINITARLQELLAASAIGQGLLHVSALHTTVAITVNEDEERLRADIENHFLKLAPPRARWLHNDIHLRDCPPDEPENAHAHLIAMMLGHQQTIAVHEGRLVLGKWQSVLMAELDGPRRRTLAVSILGA